MLYFNDINVTINGTPFLANSLSLSTQSQELRTKAIGESFPDYSYRNGIPESTIQANFAPKLSTDPFINYINNYSGVLSSFNCDGQLVNLSSLSGNFWVQQYSIDISPNAAANSSVTLRSYLPLSGDISASANNLDYVSDSKQIPSFWTTRFEGGIPEDSSVNVLGVSYQYNIDYLTSYRIGKITPANIQVNEINETCSIQCEYSSNVPLTKVYLTGVLGKSTLAIYGGSAENINTFDVKYIDLKNFTLTEASTEINTSDRIIVNMVFNKQT